MSDNDTRGHDNGESASEKSPLPTRRTVLKWFTYALGGVSAAAVATPIVAFLLGPVLRRRSDQWVDAGPVSEFPAQATRRVDLKNPLRNPRDAAAGKTAVYVRHAGDRQFQVFAINCTHLGCPVTWFPEAGLFMCPCHGGVYYQDGAHAAGPPPRGLYEYPHRIVEARLQVKIGYLPLLQQTPGGGKAG